MILVKNNKKCVFTIIYLMNINKRIYTLKKQLRVGKEILII